MILTKFSQKENSIELTQVLLTKLGIKVTNKTLEEDLRYHPDFPSLLSISDTLNSYGIENLAVITNLEQIRKMGGYCVIPIKGKKSVREYYSIISTIDDKSITIYDPEEHEWRTVPITVFKDRWASRTALFVNANNARDEKDYKKLRSAEIASYVGRTAALLIIPILTIISLIHAFIADGTSAIFPILFSVIALAGSFIGGLLIWYELDQHNPMLQQICGKSEKINCGAVLHSNAARVFGISWSAVGFVYFSGSLINLLIFGVSNTVTLSTLAWVNTFALPYVFFSIYYQWRVVKQWCLLCLSVQALLVLQLTVSLLGDWHISTNIYELLAYTNFFHLSIGFGIPIVFLVLFLPVSRLAKESKTKTEELQRIKHHPSVLRALLAEQKLIKGSTGGLGIIFGSRTPTHTIIKVCNPYCEPCSRSHKHFEELLDNNPNIQLQIIYNATIKENDIRKAPVKHFLAIASKNDESITRKALDDWYLSKEKEYNVFAEKYPMNGELALVETKVTEMYSWCEQNEVMSTPTFFIDGHQLPESYRAADLKYFLSI